MTAVERRFNPVPVEVRGDATTPKIGGYAAPFHRQSQNLGGFVEMYSRGFFNDSASRGWPDVMARYNHSDSMLLGTTGGGTLSLRIEDQGLFYEVVLPQSRMDVYELVSRGDVRKSSTAFRVLEDDWAVTDQNYPLRTLVTGQLVDVAPVNTPAYTDTTASKRAKFVLEEARGALESLARKMDAAVDDVLSLAQEDELRRFFIRTDKRGGPPPKPKPKPMKAAAAAAILASRLADSGA
jgi:HK97 family phage prohead protease